MIKNKIITISIVLGFFCTPVSAVSTDLYWYLAASMVRPGTEIVDLFNRNGNFFRVVLLTGGSGQLLAKMKSSRKGDLYTPAAMDYVSRAEKLGLVRNFVPLIVQTPVFALSSGGSIKVHSWSDLTKTGIRIGLGNPKTMALGKSYEVIKKKMGQELTDLIASNKVVEGMNISQIVNYLKADIIDAGIAFESTAKANDLSYISIPAAYNHQEIAPLIRLKSERNKENTSLFIEFIFANMAIFEKNGFIAVGD